MRILCSSDNESKTRILAGTDKKYVWVMSGNQQVSHSHYNWGKNEKVMLYDSYVSEISLTFLLEYWPYVGSMVW